MRLVDLAIDLAAVLGASRGVAARHVALRARQLERYGVPTTSASASVALGRRRAAAAGEHEHAPGRPGQEGQEEGRPVGKAAVGEEGERVAADAEAAGKEKEEASSAGLSSSSPAPSSPAAAAAGGGGSGVHVHGLRSNELDRSLPSFVIRSSSQPPPPPLPLKPGPSSSSSRVLLRDLRQREYDAQRRQRGQKQEQEQEQERRGHAESETAAVQAKPHPLDPRFQLQSAVGGQAGGSAAAEGVGSNEEEVPADVDVNVFRTGRVAARAVVPEKPPAPVATRDAETGPVREDVVQQKPEKEETRSAADTSPSPAATPTEPVRKEPQETPEPPNQTTTAPIDEKNEAVPTTKLAPPAYELRESKVPASRISRLWNYGGLAAGMLGGALSESISRSLGGGSSNEQGSVMLSAANMERLVSRLSRMRGAALKLGQMMSIQDSKVLPGPLQEVLQRVQDRADYMPAWQRDRVLAADLGADWRALFSRFDEKPVAAASIGQVHRATLRSTGDEVAVKIQFPGVADSINSDLDNLGVLLAATRLLPRGLYLNKTIDNARTELAWECDYEREAECARRYAALLADEPAVFGVPRVHAEASGRQVLTMEYMEGVGVTRAAAAMTQAQRDWVGTQILRLCLREITEFRFMQTDPNWTNFLFNARRNRLELLDFGASREYPERFVHLYVRLLAAAARLDRAAVADLSRELGYLTGHESRAMLEAHTQSVLTLAEPFLASAPDVYDFRGQTITDRVRALIPVMIRERLAPPPEETYSLHRKLSGAFLLCARLGSRVRCRDMFERSLGRMGLL